MNPLTVGKRLVVGHTCAVDRPRYVNRIHHIAKALGEPVGTAQGGRKGTGETPTGQGASRVIRPTRPSRLAARASPGPASIERQDGRSS